MSFWSTNLDVRMFLFVLPIFLAACGEPESTDFKGRIDEFFKFATYEDPKVFNPRVRRKVLVIDIDNHRLDPAHDQLPDDIRATSRSELNTLAIVTCNTNKVSSYGWLPDGYDHNCIAKLIAYPSGNVIRTVGGSRSPPRSIHFPFWDRVADRPTSSIVHFIEESIGK